MRKQDKNMVSVPLCGGVGNPDVKKLEKFLKIFDLYFVMLFERPKVLESKKGGLVIGGLIFKKI